MSFGSDFLRFDILTIGVRIVILFLIVPLHNVLKTYIAAAFGDDGPIRHGSNSLNIANQVDGSSLFVFFLFGYIWSKPVRTNYKEKSKHPAIATIVTACSGPLLYMFFAFLFIFLESLFYNQTTSFVLNSGSNGIITLSSICSTMANTLLNIAFVNMIPIQPFDFGEILNYFLPVKAYRKLNNLIANHEMLFSIILIVGATFFVMIFISIPSLLLHNKALNFFYNLTQGV